MFVYINILQTVGVSTIRTLHPYTICINRVICLPSRDRIEWYKILPPRHSSLISLTSNYVPIDV